MSELADWITRKTTHFIATDEADDYRQAVVEAIEEYEAANPRVGGFVPDDVIGHALDRFELELTEEQAKEILESVRRHYDAELGVNWDTLWGEIYDWRINNGY